MQFVDHEGATVTGEVWCPGPQPRTVWVLLDGRTAAVHLGSAKRPYPHELDPTAIQREGQDTLAVSHRRRGAKFAPPLSAQDWKAALGIRSFDQLALED